VAEPIYLHEVEGGGFWKCYRSVSVGRSPGAEVRLGDNSVSRSHAVIGRWGRAWFVRDNGSTNGTFLNGAPITSATDPFPLRPRDVIEFGTVALRVDAIREAPFAAIRREWLAWNDGAAVRIACAPRSTRRTDRLAALGKLAGERFLATPIFSLRENAIAKEPGSGYPEDWPCVSWLGALLVD
jgi:predicted component of type VI protein secretion system